MKAAMRASSQLPGRGSIDDVNEKSGDDDTTLYCYMIIKLMI